MSRVKRGVHVRKRHKKVLKMAKGYRGGRGKLYRQAKMALMKAGVNAYIGRKLKKRTFRALWIGRLNASVKQHGLIYSRFINLLELKNILLDRKILSELAIHEPEVFKKVVDFVKG